MRHFRCMHFPVRDGLRTVENLELKRMIVCVTFGACIFQYVKSRPIVIIGTVIAFPLEHYSNYACLKPEDWLSSFESMALGASEFSRGFTVLFET